MKAHLKVLKSGFIYSKTLVYAVMICSWTLASPATGATEFFWQAERNHQTVYLLGSIHLGNEQFYPLDKQIYRSIEDSDILLMEIADLESKNGLEYLNAKSRLADGILLTDNLSASTIKRAIKLGEKTGIPFSTFTYNKAWYYTLMMSNLVLIKMGYLPQFGIDMHISEYARDHNIPLSGFETVQQQVDILDGMPIDEKLIIQTLDDLESADSTFGDLMQAWKDGNLQEVTRQVDDSFSDYPIIKRQLLDNRNKDWLKQLESILIKNNKIFIVVGAAHLTGSSGLIEQLREMGFTLRNPI